MSKPIRERDAEVAREAIVEAGEQVFAQKGFEGARIDSIAAASGYNKSLIFHYFGDKEGLYRAVIKRLKMRLHTEYLGPLTNFVESSDEINVDRVRHLVELAIAQYLAFLTNHPRNLRMMAWEAAEGWRTFMADPKEGLTLHKASFICVQDFLKRAQAEGIINPDLSMRFLVMSIVNLCIMHLLNFPRYKWFFEEKESAAIDGADTLLSARQQILQLVLYGVFASPTEGTPK